MGWREETRQIARKEFAAIEAERKKHADEAANWERERAAQEERYASLPKFTASLKCPFCGSTKIAVKIKGARTSEGWMDDVFIDQYGERDVFERTCERCGSMIRYERRLAEDAGASDTPAE